MELVSLKEILIKKSDGNKNLQTLIEYMGEKQLFNSVVESLEKMSKKMGENANEPTVKFGKNLDLTDKMQLRDAIGHHLAHYKAALKAHHASPEGSPEAANYRKVADEHMGKALPLLHLAGKASRWSKGKLMLKYPSMMPWEANYTSMKPAATGTGRLHRDAKGLGAHEVLAPGAKDDGYGIPNFHYFEMPPNPGHKKVAGHNFHGGYPWEEIQLGAPEDVDAKKAYLHIPDVPIKDKFEEHPFDKHPISTYHKIRHSQMSDAMKKRYGDELAAYRTSPHHEKWLENEEAKEKNDPTYETHGHNKSGHIYEGLPLKPQRAHINDYPHVERGAPSEQGWETEKYIPGADDDEEGTEAAPGAAAAPTPTAAVAPKVKKKAAAGGHPLDKTYEAWKKMPPEHQQSLLDALPALRQLVKERGGK